MLNLPSEFHPQQFLFPNLPMTDYLAIAQIWGPWIQALALRRLQHDFRRRRYVLHLLQLDLEVQEKASEQMIRRISCYLGGHFPRSLFYGQ